MEDEIIQTSIEERMKNYEETLSQLVSIPSISAESKYRKETRECAEVLKNVLKDIGAETEIVETSGNPLVIGNISENRGAKTIAIYAHYDVQPVSSPDEWKSDPFSLKKEDGKYYGRGSSDDKGNLLTALTAAGIANKEELDLNFQFIFEGTEESGSLNFEEGIKKARDSLDPDIIIVADGGWISSDNPSVEYGLRGLLYMHWNLKTAEKNAHSGSTGGPARNPLLELTDAANKCIDSKTGRLKIPNIYEEVREPTSEEIDHWKESKFSVKGFKDSFELKHLRVEDRTEILKAIWTLPTFEIHGLVGGNMQKNGQTTILPGEGQLLVSMRLVPDQNPRKIFEKVKEYVTTIYPEIEVKGVSWLDPYWTDPKSKTVETAVSAMERTFKLPASKIRSGGSIGAVSIMERTLDNPEIIIMSFGLPENGTHGPNEFYSEKQARKGMEAYIRYFELIAES